MSERALLMFARDAEFAESAHLVLDIDSGDFSGGDRALSAALADAVDSDGRLVLLRAKTLSIADGARVTIRLRGEWARNRARQAIR